MTSSSGSDGSSDSHLPGEHNPWNFLLDFAYKWSAGPTMHSFCVRRNCVSSRHRAAVVLCPVICAAPRRVAAGARFFGEIDMLLGVHARAAHRHREKTLEDGAMLLRFLCVRRGRRCEAMNGWPGSSSPLCGLPLLVDCRFCSSCDGHTLDMNEKMNLKLKIDAKIKTKMLMWMYIKMKMDKVDSNEDQEKSKHESFLTNHT